MASYIVNKAAVAKARSLIRGRQYVLDSDWGDVQPKANDEKAFLASHSWSEYAEWHLGLTEGAVDETKARYAFVYGDLRRLHRSGLIACHYRAAEWRHKSNWQRTALAAPRQGGRVTGTRVYGRRTATVRA